MIQSTTKKVLFTYVNKDCSGEHVHPAQSCQSLPCLLTLKSRTLWLGRMHVQLVFRRLRVRSFGMATFFHGD